jgi:hypothetical protein
MEIKKSIRREGFMISKMVRVLMTVLLFLIYTIPAKDQILILRRGGKDFEDALKGLNEELKADFELKDKLIDKKTDVFEIRTEIALIKPKAVVLMDNSAITLYKKYQAGLNADEVIIPSISIMGVFIKDAINDIKCACGISYEIPIVTSIVNLRVVLGSSMKKVGVIHREFLNDFLKKNKEFCKMEGIEIVDITLPNKSDNYKILLKNGLKTLLNEKKVDVLWVPNDNAFLNIEIIRDVWVPAVKKEKKPVVVGVELLVNPKLDFGTFAVLPDHVALGSQAAEMIYDILDNDWQCEDGRVDPPLAVYKIINLKQAKKIFGISDEKLKMVDKTVK